MARVRVSKAGSADTKLTEAEVVIAVCLFDRMRKDDQRNVPDMCFVPIDKSTHAHEMQLAELRDTMK